MPSGERRNELAVLIGEADHRGNSLEAQRSAEALVDLDCLALGAVRKRAIDQRADDGSADRRELVCEVSGQECMQLAVRLALDQLNTARAEDRVRAGECGAFEAEGLFVAQDGGTVTKAR